MRLFPLAFYHFSFQISSSPQKSKKSVLAAPQPLKLNAGAYPIKSCNSDSPYNKRGEESFGESRNPSLTIPCQISRKNCTARESMPIFSRI